MNKHIEPHIEIVRDQIGDDQIELAQIFGVIVDERKVIIAIMLLFALGGIFNALFSTPVYKADALLQVEPKSTGMPGLGELTGAFELESDAITEIEVLKSRMVLGQVVDDLRLELVSKPSYFPIIGRGLSRLFGSSDESWITSLFSSYAWGSEYIQLSKFDIPPKYIGENLELVVEKNNKYELFSHGNILIKGEVGKLVNEAGFRVLVSDITNRPGLRFIVKRIPRLTAIRELQEELSVVEKGRKSGVLVVSLTGTNADQTKRILDSVSKKYLLQNVQRMSAEAEKSLDFLDSQLPDIKKNLMTSEYTLNSYRLKNESVDLTLETKTILESVVTLEEQLNELALEETKLKKLFTPEHPNYLSLLEKRRMLTQEKDKLQDKIKDLPVTQQQVLRLTRDVEVNQAIYVEMLNKVQELAIMKAGTIGNVRILDSAALLEEPIKPKRALIMVLAILAGLIVGVVFAFVRVSMRQGIKSVEELEAIGLPVYATVPLSETQKMLTREIQNLINKKESNDKNNSSALLAAVDSEDIAIESLRSLRTSMHFAMLETQNNILMVSGSGPDLGKSFISANFASVCAQAGKKILVVDCDLRKGHMHRVFGVDRAQGLSELLSGQIDKEMAVKNTEIEGLHFVSSGVIPPNPAEILLHENLQKFLKWASEKYDIVIVDTPPVLAVTDATIVGSYVGVTMFVVKFEETQRKELEMAISRCKQSGVAVKGCILNSILPRSASKYGCSDYQYISQKYVERQAESGSKIS